MGIGKGWGYNVGEAAWGRMADAVMKNFQDQGKDAWQRITPGNWRDQGGSRRLPVDTAKAAPEARVTPLVEVTVPLRMLPVLLNVVAPVSVSAVPLTVPPVTPVVPLTEPLPERVAPETTVMLPPVNAELRASVP